jgi:hypothetical protein
MFGYRVNPYSSDIPKVQQLVEWTEKLIFRIRCDIRCADARCAVMHGSIFEVIWKVSPLAYSASHLSAFESPAASNSEFVQIGDATYSLIRFNTPTIRRSLNATILIHTARTVHLIAERQRLEAVKIFIDSFLQNQE